MDRIEALFPAYSPEDRALVRAAYDIASKALEDMKRGNGAPFIEHAEKVAKIAADEIEPVQEESLHALYPPKGTVAERACRSQ